MPSSYQAGGLPRARGTVPLNSLLLVGDAACVEVMRDCLSEAFQVVSVGHGGTEGVQKCPGLVLVDARDLDGAPWEKDCAALLAAFPKVPVIVMLARGTVEARRRALAAGAVDWVVEPILVEAVKSRLAAHLASTAGRERLENGVLCEAIVDSINSGIMVTDAALRVQFANPYVSRWSGWSREELLQAKLEEFCPALATRLEEGQTSGEVSCGFCDLECHLGFRVFPLRGLPPHVDGGFILSFTDLSRIMELRRALRLKERLTAMGEVIAKVAHEIRNPLFAVSGAAQLLSQELALDAGHRKLLDSILAQARRMNGVVQHLLEFTSEPRPRSVHFDLAAAVAEAVEMCGGCFAERNVTAKVAPSEPVLLWGDRGQIIQAVENLLRNGAEASAAGETVDVEIVAEPGPFVTVNICDRGQGVPEPDRERIFELFYTTKRGGVGLGLPISRKLMEAHGGEIKAAPRVGGGSCFSITLPKDGADA